MVGGYTYYWKVFTHYLAELFRELRRKTVRVQRVDKEAYVREICEG